MNQAQNSRSRDHTFRSIVRVRLPLRMQEEALEMLGSVREQVRFEPGCISSRLYRDVSDGRILMLEDVWQSREEMEHYLQSDVYRRVLLVVEMAEMQPEIHFDTVVRSDGMETIVRARSPAFQR